MIFKDLRTSGEIVLLKWYCFTKTKEKVHIFFLDVINLVALKYLMQRVTHLIKTVINRRGLNRSEVILISPENITGKSNN